MSYHITDDEPFHPTPDILTRLRLELFLETYCPARLSQIDSIMDFYQGNDEALFHDLQKSYPNSVVPTPRDVYRHELHTFYEHHDSTKIKNIELMLDKFEGHEDVLFVDLYERYSKKGHQPPSKNTSRRSSLGATRETTTSTDIASIREQLRQYLTQRDPRRLSKLDRIMEYYKGREMDIFKDLEQHQEMLQSEQQQQESNATTAVDGEEDDGIKYDSGVALAYIRYMAFQNPEKMVEIHDTLRVVDSMGPSFLAGLEMPPNDVVLPVEYPQMLHLHHLLLLRLQTAAKEALQLNEHLTKEGKAVVAARLEAIEAMHERTSARIISVAEDFQKKCRRSQSESLPSNNGGASSYANTSVPPTPSVPPLNQKQFDDDILGFPQTRGDRGGGVSVPPSFPEFDMVGGEESISLPDTPPLQTQALTDLLRGFEVALLDVHQELAELRSMMLNTNNSSNKPSSPRSVTTSGGRSASTNLLQPQQQTQQQTQQQQQPPAILPLRNLNGDTIGYVSTEKNVGSNHSNSSSTTGREEFTRGQSFDGTAVMNPSRGSSAVSVNVGPPPPLLSRGNSQYVNAAAIPPDFEEFGGIAENTGRNVANDGTPSRLGVEAARRLSTLEQETSQQAAITAATSNTSNPMDPLFRAKAMLHILQDAAPPGASFEMTISEDGKTSFAVKTGPTQPPTTTQIPPQMASSDAGEGGNQQRGGQLPTSPTSPIIRNPNTTPKVLPHPNVLKNLKSMVTMICHVIVVRRSFERVSSSPRHGSRSPSSPARGAPPQRYPQQQQQQQLSSSPPNWEEYEGVFSPPATRQPQAAQPQQQRLKSSASPIREGSDDSRIPSIVRSIFDRTRAIQQLSDDLPQSEEGGGVPYSNYQPPPYLRGYWSTYPTPDGNGGKQQQQKGVSWAPNIEQIQPDIDDDERPRQYPQIYRVPTTTSTSPSPSSDNGRSLKLFPNFSGSGGSAGSNGGGNGSPRNRHGGVQTPAVPKGVPIQFPPPNLTEAPKPWQTQASRNLNL